MGCNVIGSTISAKHSALFYSGKLGSGTVHLTFKHGSKKSYVYCDGRTPVNGINQPAKLCEGSRKHPTEEGERPIPTQLCQWAIDLSPAWT